MQKPNASDPEPTPKQVGGKLRPDVERLWRRYYPTYTDSAFLDRVRSVVRPDMAVLDVGAGSGSGLQSRSALKGLCARIVGIDLDPRVLDNPELDEAHVADVCNLPFGDAEFDLIYHTMVAEHLSDPQRAFLEMSRVLKPGGQIMFVTPSRYYYPMFIAGITPTKFHSFLVKHFGSGRTEHEVFPTFYRVNSRTAIAKISTKCGLHAITEEVPIPPGYLRFHPLAFRLGILYERLIEKNIPALRGQLWVTLIKPEEHTNPSHL